MLFMDQITLCSDSYEVNIGVGIQPLEQFTHSNEANDIWPSPEETFELF